MKKASAQLMRMLRRQMEIVGDTYRRLNPYSRFVFLLKFLIPFAAAAFVAAILIVPNVGRIAELRIDMPKLDTERGITFNISGGRITGQGENGMMFELEVGDFTENKSTGIMSFVQIAGRIFGKDDSWLDLRGSKGEYDQGAFRFALSGDVRMLDDRENRIFTEEAVVDIRAKSVEGAAAVRAITPFGVVEGAGYRFVKDGSYEFFGRVKGSVDTDKLKGRR